MAKYTLFLKRKRVVNVLGTGNLFQLRENGEGFFLDGVLGGLVDDDEEREELLDGDTPRQEKGSKPKKKEVYWEQNQGGAQLDKI